MTRATEHVMHESTGDDGSGAEGEDALDVADTLVEPTRPLARSAPSAAPFPGFVDLAEDTDLDAASPWFAREAEALAARSLPPRLMRDRGASHRVPSMTRAYEPPAGPPRDEVIDDEPRWEDLSELLASATD